MNAEIQCDNCDGSAEIKYVQIPHTGPATLNVSADGQHSSGWTYIIECPRCGRREQSSSTRT